MFRLVEGCGIQVGTVWGRLTSTRDYIECITYNDGYIAMKDLLAGELEFWSSYDGVDSHFRGEMS